MDYREHTLRLLGKPPHVRPWHPRFSDYALITDSLADIGLNERSNLLMIADAPTIFTATFSDGGDRVVRIRSSHMLRQPYEVYEPLHGRFDVCLIEIGELEFPTADEILDRIAPMMRNGGTVLVVNYQPPRRRPNSGIPKVNRL